MFLVKLYQNLNHFSHNIYSYLKICLRVKQLISTFFPEQLKKLLPSPNTEKMRWGRGW